MRGPRNRGFHSLKHKYFNRVKWTRLVIFATPCTKKLSLTSLTSSWDLRLRYKIRIGIQVRKLKLRGNNSIRSVARPPGNNKSWSRRRQMTQWIVRKRSPRRRKLRPRRKIIFSRMHCLRKHPWHSIRRMCSTRALLPLSNDNSQWHSQTSNSFKEPPNPTVNWAKSQIQPK